MAPRCEDSRILKMESSSSCKSARDFEPQEEARKGLGPDGPGRVPGDVRESVV